MIKSRYYPLNSAIRLFSMAILVIALTLSTGGMARAASGPAVVDLGTASAFVILTKTGVTNVPISDISGNVGASPIAATGITGLSLIADSTNTFSTSTQVTGKIYASNYADPTPANMTTAVSNMETAYTDAAGRTLPDFTELYSGDLSGRTLAPGLYKWGTGVLITTNVTLDGPADAVWIFQIAQNLTMGSGAKVLLSGGAQAKNIFWQVGGGVGVEIGTTAHIEGTILAQKAINFRTGASMNGRALAQTEVTLDQNVLVIPGFNDSVSNGETTGVFRPGNATFYLKKVNATGPGDAKVNFGRSSDLPVVGDWNGDGVTTPGVYRNGTFYLRNTNTTGNAEFIVPFGIAGDQPIAGDWDVNGTETIGVFRSSTSTFYLRNTNTPGAANIIIKLGLSGDLPLAGDWNGDGTDTVGVFRPGTAMVYLKNTNAAGPVDKAFRYGMPGDLPVTGDWNGDSIDTISVYRNGVFFLRNTNSTGIANFIFTLGSRGDLPIAGKWGLP